MVPRSWAGAHVAHWMLPPAGLLSDLLKVVQISVRRLQCFKLWFSSFWERSFSPWLYWNRIFFVNFYYQLRLFHVTRRRLTQSDDHINKFQSIPLAHGFNFHFRYSTCSLILSKAVEVNCLQIELNCTFQMTSMKKYLTHLYLMHCRPLDWFYFFWILTSLYECVFP